MKNFINYIVKTGNWVTKIKMNESTDTRENAMEAATQAIECVFGNSEFENGKEIISLLYDDDTDYFDRTDDLAPPPPSFGVITGVVKEEIYKKNKEQTEVWWYFPTSELFANASQSENVVLAKEAEEENKEEFDKFKQFFYDLKKPKKSSKSKKK